MPNVPNKDIEEKLKLIEFVREAIQRDNQLREKYQTTEKFRFVRDRLQSLLETLEKSLPDISANQSKSSQGLASDETSVYVYLYNAQGLQFKTWQNLVTPKVFYEYSVNRPIYAEKSHIDSLLRTKTNKAQHAYLTIAIKREFIKPQDENAPKDAAGNSAIKVKEGSLNIKNVLAFTHQEIEYLIGEEGVLIKKN